MSTDSYQNTPVRRVLAFARNTWRGLTSMRTALILLFLLAVAALPGVMLPQRALNSQRVAEYIAEHGWWGRLLDRLGFFAVYGSVWFSAIYLLLMVSLVGCLVPRSVGYVRSMLARPVVTPRNLSRLPHHVYAEVDADPEQVLRAADSRLSGWRKDARDGDISAERGYLHETGNLVFHFAVLGLIMTFALGKMYAYEGQVIVHANGSEFCNAGIYAFDTFRAGVRVDGTEVTPFCITVDDFTPDYAEDGRPDRYLAQISYSVGDDLATDTWRRYDLEVNHPLRISGDRVYLQGHGFAPVFTVTFPDGQQRTKATQWRPSDQVTLLSDGATKFDPPGVTDSRTRRENQLAITGLFAPTALFHGDLLNSAGPWLNDPAVAVDVMRGELGIDSGYGQSIFEIDQRMVESGRLAQVARENLGVGDEIVLDDGTTVSFDGVQRWVSLQVSHDPTQGWMLGFAVAMVAGLLLSLTIKRRRIWVRVTPAAGDGVGGRTVIEVGGLARTDQAGYGDEFTRIANDVLRTAHELAERGRADDVRRRTFAAE